MAGGILASGPWAPALVRATWRDDPYVASPEQDAAADRVIASLAERGSPSHDGLAGRLDGWSLDADGGLALTLQPARWSLRLVASGATGALSAMCVVRDRDGRWLAGRRAEWVATWAGRWSLGAAGAVEVGESPADTLGRELAEEWSVAPADDSLAVLALLATPDGTPIVVGAAVIDDPAAVRADAEHDTHEWWPPDPGAWPEHAHAPLRMLAAITARLAPARRLG